MKRITEAAVAELSELAQSGLLTPEAVLNRAQEEGSALRPLFTWEDERAAHLRRLDEARDIIVSVRVKIEPRPDMPMITVRAYVSLAEDRVAGGGYRPITIVLSDPNQRAQLLRTAIQEIAALQKKYEQLSELAQVFAALEQTRQVNGFEDDVRVNRSGRRHGSARTGTDR